MKPGTFFLAALLAVPLSASAASDKPNIVVILADDLGYHDVGFQGSTRIRTPNLDQLAAGGVICSDGHVTASVCSPSRAGLMTGRYQQRFGHEANVPPRPFGMDPGERTLGEALQQLGYRTAVVGKWHLGDEKPQHPNERGFDEFWGFREGSRSYWYNSRKDAGKSDNPHAVEHNGRLVAFEGHLSDCLGDEAVRFIRENRDRPFFLYLAFNAPHSPFESKPEDREALGGADHYAGLVFGLDRNVGKVMAALDACAIRDNTLTWFLSDNGGVAKDASNVPLGGKKGTKFEGGQRVPFVVNWPKRLPPGSVYPPMVSSLDIYATSVVAAGGSLRQPRPLDGVDLMPYLTRRQGDVPHERLYWRKLECAAMREGKWKLIRVDELGCALYDLESDIGESRNLASALPERVEELKRRLAAWEQDKTAPLWKEAKTWTKWRREYHAERFAMKPPEPLKTPLSDAATSRVLGTFVVPADVASFDARTVEIRLYKIHPLLADAPADLVEKIDIENVTHAEGAETRREFVIGAKKKLEEDKKYYITLFLLKDGKRTHMGRVTGKFLCTVLTHGEPDRVSLSVLPVR